MSLRAWTHSLASQPAQGLLLLLLSLSAARAAEHNAMNPPQPHAFEEPLTAVDDSPAAQTDSAALEAACARSRARLQEIKAGNDADQTALREVALHSEVADLENFAAANPNSAWTPSLRAHLGRYYRQRGRPTLALVHWEKAWTATKHLRQGEGKRTADYTLAHWTRLLASLGRYESLSQIFEETKGRIIDDGALSQMWARTKEAFVQMRVRPGDSYQCGTFALESVARLTAPGHDSATLLAQPSPSTGFTLKQLSDFSQQLKLNLAALQRNGGQELVVPSVVHWQQNHYGAIVRQDGALYRVVDPTFEDPQFLTADAINAEASGYFLVPQDKIPRGWKTVSASEASTVVGRGNPNFMADARDLVCALGNTLGCPPGSSEPGSCSALGMPAWRVSEPYLNLWLHDTPLAYSPAKGATMALELAYQQRDETGTPGNVFSFGKGWRSTWTSYIETLSGTSPTLAVYLNLPGGGRLHCPFTNGEFFSYYANLKLRVLTTSGAVTSYELLYPDGGKIVYDFFRRDASANWSWVFMSRQVDPQGRQTQFLYPNYDPNTLTLRLEQVIDPDGRITQLYYETNFTYYHDLVTRVEDPFLRSARLTYSDNAELIALTDTAGLTSRLTYNPANYWWPATLTTPYGQTTFAPTGDGSGAAEGLDRRLTITVPGGGRHIFAFFQNCSTAGLGYYQPAAYPSSDVPQGTPLGTLDNKPDVNNSFYWGPRQSVGLPSDIATATAAQFRKARLRHWLQGTVSEIYTTKRSIDTLSIERDFSPETDGSVEGQKTWFDYVGKPAGQPGSTGAQILPAVVARRLPDGSTAYSFTQRNALGLPTSVTSTYGSGSTTRTYSYTYDSSNQVDLLQESGPNGLIATYTYDGASHQIKTITRPVAGEPNYVTTYNYRPTTRQIESILTPDGLTTSFYYFADHRLERVEVQPINRIERFTYLANGLVQTYTDARGVVQTFTWDNLQRITRIDFSSGGFIQNSYALDHELYPGGGFNILDLAATKDRNGRWTYFDYNGQRQVITRTEATTPQQITRYGYCPCGALETITNARNEVTRFLYDNAGRLKSTVYADSTSQQRSVNYDYNLLGQLIRTKDHNGAMVGEQAFNNQGLVSSISNPFGQVATIAYDIEDRPNNLIYANGPSITQTFDNFDRLRTRVTSGAGTETWTYVPQGLKTYTDQLDSANSRTTTYDYYLAQRQITVTDAQAHATSQIFNSAGDRVTLIDANNQSTTWEYDYINRIVRKKLSGTTVLETEMDYNGQVIRRWTLEKGHTYFTFDLMGNLTLINYPLKADVTLAYDALNRLIQVADGTFGAISFDYTAYGRLLFEDGPWASDRLTYSYTVHRLRDGLTLEQPDGPWNVGYGYDSAWRLRTITGAVGPFTYTYNNPSAWAHRVDLPNGMSINNTPDALGRLDETFLRNNASISLNSHRYTYDWSHQRRRQTRGGLRFEGSSFSNYTDYDYYRDAQLKSARGYESGGAPRQHEILTWTYDPAGNLSRRDNHQLVQYFNRDTTTPTGRDQLSSVNYSGNATVAGMFSGNATSLTINSSAAATYADASFALSLPVAVSYTATVNNGSASVSDTIQISSAAATFQYDNNGNLRSDNRRVFTYDDENQLIRVEVSGQWAVDYVYDGLGRRRVRKQWVWNSGWVSNGETRSLYDGMQVIQERDGANIVRATYTRGLDLSGSLEGAGGIGGLLARTDTARTLYYHADGSGTITALLDANQNLVARYLYDPFGNLLGSAGAFADANTYRFSSKDYDPKAGIYYYGYRFYDPNLQRWINRDPIGEEGGMNLYGFVGNNPMTRTDPLGLDYRYGRDAQFMGIPLPEGYIPYVYGDTYVEQFTSEVNNIWRFLANAGLHTMNNVDTIVQRIESKLGAPGSLAALPFIAGERNMVAGVSRMSRCVGANRPSVQLEFSFVQAVERQTIARDFYRKGTGWTDSKIASHLRGIDFNLSLAIIDLPVGTRLIQYGIPGRSMGNYFAHPGTPANTLGIYTSGVNEFSRVLVRPTQALRSTAASVVDDWSMKRYGWRIETGGGGIQFFMPNAPSRVGP